MSDPRRSIVLPASPLALGLAFAIFGSVARGGGPIVGLLFVAAAIAAEVPGAVVHAADQDLEVLDVACGATPQRLFDTTRADYFNGQYDLCVSGFEMYRKKYGRITLRVEAVERGDRYAEANVLTFLGGLIGQRDELQRARALIADGRRLYEVENGTFTHAGKVGVWTKADSVTQFDDLTAAKRALEEVRDVKAVVEPPVRPVDHRAPRGTAGSSGRAAREGAGGGPGWHRGPHAGSQRPRRTSCRDRGCRAP